MALWALAETETAEEHRSVGASEETNSNATRDEEAEEETAAAGISSASAARRSRSSLGASTLDALASAFARAASSATPRQLATGLRALAASGLTLSVADAKALAEAVAATFGKDVPLSAESPRGGGDDDDDEGCSSRGSRSRQRVLGSGETRVARGDGGVRRPERGGEAQGPRVAAREETRKNRSRRIRLLE